MAFQTKWSPDVKAGVFVLVFERGQSARAAHAAACAGMLPQLKPGEDRPAAAPGLPVKTVQDWCRHERARRGRVAAAAASPDKVLGETIGRLVAVLEAETRRTEMLSAQRKLPRGELAKVARDAIELARLIKAAGAGGEPAAESSGASTSAPESSSGFLAGLAAAPDITV